MLARQQKFGKLTTSVGTASIGSEEEKLKKRQERFGAATKPKGVDDEARKKVRRQRSVGAVRDCQPVSHTVNAA